MDVISVNLGNRAHNVTVGQQRTRLAQLAKDADVIVTQEALRSRLITPRGWRGMPIVGGGAEQVRIFVRKGTKLLGSGAWRMHRGVEGSWPARWLPFIAVELEDSQLFVMDIHLNSGIDAGGRWAPIGERARFTQHHIDSLARWASCVQAMGHPALMLGDTNVDAYADQRHKDPRLLTAQWCDAGPKLREAMPAVKSGTHAGSPRRIDRAFASRGLDVSVRDLARTTPYDHQPIHVRVS